MYVSTAGFRFALAAPAAFLGGGTAPLVLGGDLPQAGPTVGHADASGGRVWLSLQQRAAVEARAGRDARESVSKWSLADLQY